MNLSSPQRLFVPATGSEDIATPSTGVGDGWEDGWEGFAHLYKPLLLPPSLVSTFFPPPPPGSSSARGNPFPTFFFVPRILRPLFEHLIVPPLRHHLILGQLSIRLEVRRRRCRRRRRSCDRRLVRPC